MLCRIAYVLYVIHCIRTSSVVEVEMTAYPTFLHTRYPQGKKSRRLYAIGALFYLWGIVKDRNSNIGFILGKAKLTPHFEPTIFSFLPSAGGFVVEMAELIISKIDLSFLGF